MITIFKRIILSVILSFGLTTVTFSAEIDDLYALFTLNNQEDYEIVAADLEVANELLIAPNQTLIEATTEYDEALISSNTNLIDLNIAQTELTLVTDTVLTAESDLTTAEGALLSAQTELALVTDNVLATEAELASATETLLSAQTELALATDTVLATQAELVSAEVTFSSATLAYDDSIALIAGKDSIKKAAEIIFNDVKTAQNLAQNEFDLIELELDKTLSLLQQLDLDQIDSLIKETKNSVSKGLTLNIDSSDLQVIFDNNYGSKEIKSFTKAYEKEARFLIQVAKFETEGKTERAESLRAKAQKEKKKFLEKAIKQSEKEAIKQTKKAEKEIAKMAAKETKKAKKETKKS